MQNKWPKISIVTPSYNQGDYIEKTIRSVVDQNYPNLEYVIIDGGSTDSTISIIKKYQHNLHYWVSEKDEGQADAINKGFSHTSGSILSWINSDDLLMPGSLWLAARIFSTLNEVSWISGIPTTVNQDGFLMHRRLRPAYLQSLIKKGWYHGAFLGYIMQEGTFWRRELWQAAGGSLDNEFLTLDFNLWKKFAEHSELTTVFTSLGAFRFNPHQKTAVKNSYLKAVGVPFPQLQRLISLPLRVVFHLLFTKVRASSKIFYDLNSEQWVYRQGWWSNNLLSLRSRRFTLRD